MFHKSSNDRNAKQDVFLSFGTSFGTPHRHGASLSVGAVVCLFGSYVPNISFRLKNIGNRSIRKRKPAYTRVKGFLHLWNTGERYERI